mmetsp:Transcript_23304/g.51736  ORF Transcript_23304/g.51736 Transcript_23304/m.51736 type:complete len:213 (+) Transcript_23304:914-1552(+)
MATFSLLPARRIFTFEGATSPVVRVPAGVEILIPVCCWMALMEAPPLPMMSGRYLGGTETYPSWKSAPARRLQYPFVHSSFSANMALATPSAVPVTFSSTGPVKSFSTLGMEISVPVAVCRPILVTPLGPISKPSFRASTVIGSVTVSTTGAAGTTSSTTTTPTTSVSTTTFSFFTTFSTTTTSSSAASFFFTFFDFSTTAQPSTLVGEEST